VRQRSKGRAAVVEKGWTGQRACLDLVAVDRCDEVGPRGEMPVDRADTNPSPSSNVTHRHVDPRGDKGRGGRGDQGLLLAPGLGSVSRGGALWPSVGHRPGTSIAHLRNGTSFRIFQIGTVFRLLNC